MPVGDVSPPSLRRPPHHLLLLLLDHFSVPVLTWQQSTQESFSKDLVERSLDVTNLDCLGNVCGNHIAGCLFLAAVGSRAATQSLQVVFFIVKLMKFV